MVTPAPQPRQIPPVLLQAMPEAQPAQAAPPVPHWVLLSLAKGTQVVPEQHPFGQDAGVHWQTPVAPHTCMLPHAAHAAPAAPHFAVVCAARRTHAPFASQQPFGHELASHTHLPPATSQRWPAMQVEQAAPAVPHAVSPAVVHCPVLLQQPLGQEVALH
jgi:hypothetical protein